MFDIEIQCDITEKGVGNVKKKILQRLVTAYQAKIGVDFYRVARYEALSILIVLFKTDRSMKCGAKSFLVHVNPLLETADVQKLQTRLANPPSDSQYIVGDMYLVNNIKLSDKIITSLHLSDGLCKAVYYLKSDKNDVCGD